MEVGIHMQLYADLRPKVYWCEVHNPYKAELQQLSRGSRSMLPGKFLRN